MLRQTVLAYIVRMDINRLLGGSATPADRLSAMDIAQTLDIELTVARAMHHWHTDNRRANAHA